MEFSLITFLIVVGIVSLMDQLRVFLFPAKTTLCITYFYSVEDENSRVLDEDTYISLIRIRKARIAVKGEVITLTNERAKALSDKLRAQNHSASMISIKLLSVTTLS